MELDRERLEALLKDMEQVYRSTNFIDDYSTEENVEGEYFHIGRKDTINQDSIEEHGSGFNLAASLAETQRELERNFFLKSLKQKAGNGAIPTFRLESLEPEVVKHAVSTVESPKNVFVPESSTVVEVLENDPDFDSEEVRDSVLKENVVVVGEDVSTGFRRYGDAELELDADSYNQKEDRLVKHVEENEDGYTIYRGSVISRPEVDAASAAVIDLSEI